MANVITLPNGAEFKNQKELINYSIAQYAALQASVEKIQLLESKVKHLEELLLATNQLQYNNVETIIKSPELIIVEMQIDKLQQNALIRQLSHEEVKTLDLLVKNKRLLSNEATTIDGKVKDKKHYSVAELTLIAKKDISNGN